MRLFHHMKQFVLVTTVAALVAVIGLTVGASAAVAQVPPEVVVYADTILTNGKVLTVDKEFSIREAIAIRGGKVLATGTTAAIQRMAGPKTQRIDLAGKSVIPGVIDVHNHFQNAALTKHKEEVGANEPRFRDYLNRAQVKGSSVDELLRNIKTVVDGRKPGTWVTISIASPELGQPFWERVHRRELDAVAPNNLLMVSVPLPYFWGETIVNTKVAQLIKDFYGASPRELEIDEDGLINGRIDPEMGEAIEGDLLFDHPMESWYSAVKAEMARMASFGITTDMTRMHARYMQPLLREMEMRGEMPIRTTYAQMAPFMEDAGGYFARLGNVTNMGTDMLWIAGIGVANIDIHPCSTIKPNPATPIYPKCMLTNPTDVKYQALYEGVKVGNRIVSSKASGDLTVDQELDLIEAASKAAGITPEQIRAKGHTFDHCAMYPRPDQIERGKRLGIIWGCLPRFPGIEIASELAEVFGIEVVNKWVAPVNSILKAGGRLAGHTGEGITGDSLFTNFESLLNRKDSKGRVWAPQEAIDRTQVLRMITNGSAEYVGRPDTLGSLEAGKFADLVILDKDYMTIPIDEFHTIHSVLTMVGGKTVYKKEGN